MNAASPVMNEHAVSVTGIVKSFGDGDDRLTVLHGISLDARDGQILMLVGPSGCGKTTLLSLSGR